MDARETGSPVLKPARRAVDELLNLFSLLVFFAVTALIFRSVEFALVVTASLGFHELGHAAALTWHGLPWRISFGVAGAWTWSPLEEREKLSHLENALIHLAGPAFSLLLALGALGLQAAWQPGGHHLLILANFSAQVSFLNLLPLGNLTDGGKIVRRMVDSLEGEPRVRAVLLPVLVTAVMLSLYGLVEMPKMQDPDPFPYLLGLLLVGLWMAGSLFIETHSAARREQRRAGILPVTGKARSEPMLAGEVYFLLLVVWALLVLGLLVTAATPFWLAPEYVLGSLRNLFALFDLLGRLPY